MDYKKALMFVLDRAEERKVIGYFFDANREFTDEIFNEWQAHKRAKANNDEEEFLS